MERDREVEVKRVETSSINFGYCFLAKGTESCVDEDEVGLILVVDLHFHVLTCQFHAMSSLLVMNDMDFCCVQRLQPHLHNLDFKMGISLLFYLKIKKI